MYDDRPIFWPVFWGVLAAMVAFNVLKWGLAALLAAGLIVGLSGGLQKRGTTPVRVPTQYQQRSTVPEWPGPLGAVRDGSSRACINGVAADRVSNGWRQQPNTRCSASSN